MGQHVGVLQARRHPGAVDRRGLGGEWARHHDHEEREEHGDRGEHRDDPDDEVPRPPSVEEDRRGSEAGQHEQPQQK